MSEISKQDALEELRRRGIVTGGDTSVLETPQELPTRSEFKQAVESLLKGSAKGIVNMVGGWGNLYDELANSKDPSAFSSKGIVNTIARMGGPDLNKLQGWKGVYTAAETGAPAALMAPMGGTLFKLSTPARTAAAEFGAAGGLGLLSQQAAPESAGAQLVMQTLPYLVTGGYRGIKSKAAEKRIEEYRSLLPKTDQNIFDQFILKGQGSTDPTIANDILRLTNSVKFGELVATLNAGASEKALAGMTPQTSKLSNKEAAIAAAQALQTKLEKLKEHNAGSLFEQAKGYGAGLPLVEPTNTVANLTKLRDRYSKQATPNAEKAVSAIDYILSKVEAPKPTQDLMSGLANAAPPTTAKTIEEVQGILTEFGKKAGQGEQLIKDLALSDEKVISSAVFGGMQDDLRTAYNTASGKDRAALGLLRQARNKVADSVTAYQDALAQGLPNWLKDKSLRDINFEELSAQYNKLNPEQRAYARNLIADTDAEALKALDFQVYDNFVKQAKTTNPVTGVEGVDVGMLAANWKKLLKDDPIGADNLVTSLGTNANEFSKRMQQADVFAKRMRLAPEADKQVFENQTIRETSAAMGAGPGGYQAGKLTQLGMDIANIFGKEGVLTDEQLAKLMLPKEGMDFLKNANMSPRGQKTLESLMSLDKAEMPAFYQAGAQAARAGARMGTSDQPTVQEPAQQQQEQTPQITPEQALEELKARGVL